MDDLRWEWRWDFDAPPASVWPLVSDTERFNRPAGKGIDGVRKLVHLGAR
jgi:hypothetical protein